MEGIPDLKAWLESAELGQLYNGLTVLGFSSADDFVHCNEEDLREICSDLGLKVGTRTRFLKAVRSIPGSEAHKDTTAASTTKVKHVYLDAEEGKAIASLEDLQEELKRALAVNSTKKGDTAEALVEECRKATENAVKALMKSRDAMIVHINMEISSKMWTFTAEEEKISSLQTQIAQCEKTCNNLIQTVTDFSELMPRKDKILLSVKTLTDEVAEVTRAQKLVDSQNVGRKFTLNEYLNKDIESLSIGTFEDLRPPKILKMTQLKHDQNWLEIELERRKDMHIMNFEIGIKMVVEEKNGTDPGDKWTTYEIPDCTHKKSQFSVDDLPNQAVGQGFIKSGGDEGSKKLTIFALSGRTYLIRARCGSTTQHGPYEFTTYISPPEPTVTWLAYPRGEEQYTNKNSEVKITGSVANVIKQGRLYLDFRSKYDTCSQWTIEFDGRKESVPLQIDFEAYNPRGREKTTLHLHSGQVSNRYIGDNFMAPINSSHFVLTVRCGGWAFLFVRDGKLLGDEGHHLIHYKRSGGHGDPTPRVSFNVLSTCRVTILENHFNSRQSESFNGSKKVEVV